MKHSKALAALERSGLFTGPFDNPEVTAMAAICDILQNLPDDAARLRVMHWAFGRFSPEFKRPVPAPVETAAAAPVVAGPATRAMASMTTEIAAVAPEIAAPARVDADEAMDFKRQISELEDFFPSSTRHPAAVTAR